MLDSAHKSNPDTHWWLKGDGCDLVSGLRESKRLKWSGDVDVDSGELQRAYQLYCDLLHFIDRMDIGVNCVSDLQRCSNMLAEDKQFLVTGM